MTAQRMYSEYIEGYLSHVPVRDEREKLQCGWGGSTASSFAGRMADDVLKLTPNFKKAGTKQFYVSKSIMPTSGKRLYGPRLRDALGDVRLGARQEWQKDDTWLRPSSLYAVECDCG